MVYCYQGACSNYAGHDSLNIIKNKWDMSWLHDNHLAFSHTPFLFFCHDQQLITVRMHGHQTYHFNFCFDLMNLKQTCDPSIMRLLFPDVLPHVYLWLKWLIPVIITINKGRLIRERVINDLTCEKKNAHGLWVFHCYHFSHEN